MPLSLSLSFSIHPQVEMSSLSPAERQEIRSANLKRSLVAVCAAYLLYSALQGPDTHMVKPHPAVWRVMHGFFVLYLLFLIFLLCQETNDARMVLKVRASACCVFNHRHVCATIMLLITSLIIRGLSCAYLHFLLPPPLFAEHLSLFPNAQFISPDLGVELPERAYGKSAHFLFEFSPQQQGE